jgi:hypothetical protein
VESPQQLSEFWPISLIGIMYKVTLCPRKRHFISESQSAFIHGRQILDGILIANEMVDEARRLKKEMNLFKVDFEKDFDSVDWCYLNAVMHKMILWGKKSWFFIA